MSDDNLLERAKALRETALPRRICSIPGQTGYGNPSLNKGWDFSAVDELVRVVVPELITEVERLRSLNESLMENGNDLRTRCQKAEARIKELEAEKERIESAFLKARQCPTCKGEGTIHPIGQPIDSICPMCLGDPESMAREELERIKEGRKDD